MNKLRILIGVLLSSFTLFFIFLMIPKNYTKTYKVNDVKITESFDKKEGAYFFNFRVKNQDLVYLFPSKYKNNRNLITKIKLIEDNDDFCLILTSKELNLAPVCIKNKEQIHFILASNNIKNNFPDIYKNNNKSLDIIYQDIKIYDLDNVYLIWNYDGFYYINNDIRKKIDIFYKETYKINLVGYTQDYLIVADYDSNYTFSKLYTINFKTGELKECILDRTIYFDSYFSGYDKNYAYIVDKKESLMYEFNAKSGKIEKIDSKVLVDGKWENKPIKNLVNSKILFTYDRYYDYFVEDNNLYLNYHEKNILIAKNITSLIRVNNDIAYYLKGDILYRFDINKGEIKLLNYVEWNFNYEDLIYIN